jgi:type I restriction enzyme S subunit
VSLPRYASYKDSGVDWLGDVPTDWSIMPLKRLATLKGRLGWQNLRAEEYTDEGPYLVTSEHLVDDRVDWGRCYHVSEERYAMAPEIQLRPDDLVMMKDGAAMGKLGYIDKLPDRACLNSHLLLFRPRDQRVSNRFLYYVLGSPSFTTYMHQERAGSTFFGISQESIGSFELAVPPPRTLSVIVEFLDRETSKIDTLIAEQHRLIEALLEKRHAVVSDAVTNGLSPDAPKRRTGLAVMPEVPEHWEVSQLKRFCDEITDGAHVSPVTENGVYPFVSTRDVRDDSIDFVNCLRTSESSYAELVRNGCRPRRGDVLFSKDGTIGRTVVVEVDRDFIVASSLIIIRPATKGLDPRYLNWLCQSRPFALQVDAYVKGAGLPRLSIQNLRRVIGAFPPMKEQQQIARFLDGEAAKYGGLITEADRLITLLSERRTALISAAVTGKIDVSGWSEPDAEAA